MSSSQKVMVFKDADVDITGVTPIWVWLCSNNSCEHKTSTHGSALYWENAMRSANHHIAWHKVNDAVV